MFNQPVTSIRTLSPLMQQTRFIKSIINEPGPWAIEASLVTAYLMEQFDYGNHDLMGMLLMGGEL
jgi:hypothetical protein